MVTWEEIKEGGTWWFNNSKMSLIVEKPSTELEVVVDPKRWTMIDRVVAKVQAKVAVTYKGTVVDEDVIEHSDFTTRFDEDAIRGLTANVKERLATCIARALDALSAIDKVAGEFDAFNVRSISGEDEDEDYDP